MVINVSANLWNLICISFESRVYNKNTHFMHQWSTFYAEVFQPKTTENRALQNKKIAHSKKLMLLTV